MTIVLDAELRGEVGSQYTKKLRKEGKIPAVIYDKDGNKNISINAREFEKEYFKGDIFATLIEVNIEGKKTQVIAYDINLDPVTDRPIHIDFKCYDNSESVIVKPKFNFVGRDKSPGIKRGGFLHVAARKAYVICKNKQNIPTEIEVNIESLHLSSKVRANDVKLSDGLKFVKKDNFLICSVIGRGKSTGDSAENQAESTDAKAAEANKKAA